MEKSDSERYEKDQSCRFQHNRDHSDFIYSHPSCEIGAPWPFTLLAVAIIILILFSLVRTWLRG
jgi:hypothetical protein